VDECNLSDKTGSGASAFGGLWLAGLLFVFLTLAVWVLFYLTYGETGKLTQDETTVVALLIALLVFGGRWCVIRYKRKPKAGAREGHK
jgi:hypothetical protein